MEKKENSIEMDRMKHEEGKSLDRQVVALVNGNSGTSIEIDPSCIENEKEDHREVSLEQEFYQRIFSIIIPYIFIGCPLNFCFGKAHKNVHKFTTSRAMKVMSK